MLTVRGLIVLTAFFISLSPLVAAVSSNTKINSFNKAKRHMAEVYKGAEQTFYCGCKYTGKQVDHKSCAYKPRNPKNKRAHRVEWEHVVPAWDFGRAFPEWRNGHPSCVDSKGKKFKGRNCARKVSQTFRLMESDLYNLVPAIGEVNSDRSNKPAMKILNKVKLNDYGACKTLISQDGVEPRDEMKGFVARTYKYMNAAYPGKGIISRKNQKLFDAWDASYPPGKDEIERAKRIEAIQGNQNTFVIKDLSAKNAAQPAAKVTRK